MADFLETRSDKRERAFLVGVQTQKMAPGEGAELLSELTELVENLRMTVTRSTLVNLRAPNPATLLGSGKTEELIELAKADHADVIVFDEELSPAQQRNWEKLSGLVVIDRQEVILEIFADRAHTREAVLQVALARMEYSLPRLTRAWTHLSRQRGKGALGGEGETQLEQDRRIVRDRIAHLKSELATVVTQRATQRQQDATASPSPPPPSSATPTPANPRCSTSSPAHTSSPKTNSSPPSTRPRASSNCPTARSSSSPTPSASSVACPTASSKPSRPRSKRSLSPIS